jgi:hypothetical protein
LAAHQSLDLGVGVRVPARQLVCAGRRRCVTPAPLRCAPVLLTLSTTHWPATDLGFLLHKHPDRVQTFSLPFGSAHVLDPEAGEDRCTAALVLDVDPVGLVRRAQRVRPGRIRQRPALRRVLADVRGVGDGLQDGDGGAAARAGGHRDSVGGRVAGGPGPRRAGARAAAVRAAGLLRGGGGAHFGPGSPRGARAGTSRCG